MHSTYLSSMSLWRKGSLSFSFNDSSYLLSERTENLHSSSSHCTCCALSNHGLPVYPRFFYGFTHASLIQWSASRRLILTGFERYCQLPLYDLDRGSYRVSCSLKESNACRRRKRGNGKFGCMVWEEKSEGGDSGTDESAEAMLSLLTDKLSDTLVGRSAARRKPVDKIGRVVDERRSKGKECVRNKSLEWDSKGGYKPIAVESREDNYHQSGWSEASLRTENHVLRKDGHRKEKECAQAPSSQRNYKGEYKSSIVKTTEECYQLSGRRGVSSRAHSPGFRSEHPRMEREIAQAPSSERNSKVEYESSTVKSREDYFQLSGRNGVSSTTEDHGPRRDSSGCSSFYSASSFDDIESDAYIEDKHPEFVGGSSCDYKQNESRSSREDVLAVDVRKQFKGHDEDVHGYREISRQGSAAGSAVGSDKMMSSNKWGSRSKAEKKFTEVSVVPVQSREESSQMLSRKLEVNDSDMEIVLGHQKGFNGREDEPSSAVKLVKETVERNSQSGRVALEHAESRRKSQQVQEMSGIQGSDYQKASGFQRQFSGREMNLSSPINSNQVARKLHGQTVTETVEQTEIRRKSQQRTKFTDSKIQRAHTSGMRFESGMDNREELSTKMQGSVQKSKEQQVQTDQRFYGTAELRRRSQDLTNQMASDASKNFNYTFSDTRTNSRERNLASVVVDQVHEERQNGSGAGERGAEQVGLRKESRRPTKVSSSRWSSMERASSSKAPLYSDPLARVELKGVSTEENKISQVMLAHPSQLVGVKIGNEDLEASVELSESSSSSLTTHPQAQTANSPQELHVETKSGEAFGENLSLMLHEDALGSANRFERSSSQFVGEFVEKVQDEIFTSDFQKERTSETTSAYGDWKYIQQGPGQSGSEDLQLKRPDPRQSSDVSEKKGPSDEMWDVNDPSLHGDSQREPPEEGTSTTGGTIVRTTGRSLWNIITDVIRLRWGTHSGTNNSTIKSGGKSSSNESICSEVGFSGHDPDDNDHDNVKKRQRGTPKVPRSADLLSKASTQSQAEASESTMSRDRILEAEGDASSYSGTLGKGVTSQGTSSASVEERFDWNEDGNGNQGTPSTIAPMESSLPLLTRRVIRSSPVTEQLTESTKAKVSIGKDVTSQGTSLAFEEARFGWKEEDRGDKGIIVSLSPVDLSLPLPSRGLIRSPAIERMPETIKAKVPMCDFKENVEQATTESLTEVPKTDGKDDQLKRQKFQRNKQVPKDIFDEWENAYKLETLRRENDEKFMREALLEAQKAADVWEVPVGAVLVQNGEIIARGFNLVEELRDSTAHAEMICIREASNLLRTWRLVDTTLYVTLEPCPMCAGAILQARIDTVVWGAPNKLLGADGSWVRLFPGGGEGGSSSDQPAGPIHPFHSKITIRRGVLETQCAEMMQQFFNLRRKKKEKNPEPKTPPSCLPVSSHPSKFLSKMHDMFSIMFCL